MKASGSGLPTITRAGVLAAIGLLALGFVLGRFVGRTSMDPMLGADEVLNPAQMEATVRSAMAETSAFVRSRTLSRVFSKLDTQNVDAAASGMRTRSEYLDPVDLQLFLSAWTRFDAPAAMDAATHWPSEAGREIGMRLVMREWAASGRVIEASSYYQSIPDPEMKAIVAGPMIRGWALSGDIDGALKIARILWEQGAPIGTTDGFVRGALNSVGPEVLVERILDLDPNQGGKLERRMMRVAFSFGAREDPRVVSAAYASLEVDQQPPEWLYGALRDISMPWGETEPEAAIEWLLERADSTERSASIKEIMRAWAARDLDAAMTWWSAEEQSAAVGGDRARALRSILLAPILRRMARVRPVEASEWVEKVEKAAAREALTLRVAYFWARQDRLEAERWVEGLGLSESRSEKAKEAIARGASSTPSSDADAEDAAPATRPFDER